MDIGRRSDSIISTHSFIWMGIGVGMVVWFLESLMHITIFGQVDLLKQIFTPDVHEIWKRVLVVVLIILFSVYAQYSINFRRRTETALAQREQELFLILENNPAGIMLVDAVSRTVSFANTKALKMIGSPKEVVENHRCHKHLCPAEAGNCPILDVGKKIDLSERVLLTADGNELPILKSVTRVGYNGRDHLLEAFFDISDRKKMERDLQQAHAELDQIFQTASVAMRLLDKDFNVLKVNKTFEHLTDVSEANAVGRKCYDIFAGQTCFTEECPTHRILSGKEAVEQYVDKQRLDGKRIPCIVTATPFVGTDGEMVGVVESFRDITELKKAQNAVVSERDKLNRVLSHLPEGVIIISQDHEVEYSNELFKDHFGQSRGKACYEVIHKRKAPCEPCLMEAAVQTGQIQQAEFQTEDGRHFEKTYTPVTDVGNKQKAVARLRDDTNKKSATAAMLRAEQLAALGELAAGVAHEINNPINGIINYAQILLNKNEKNGSIKEIAHRMIKEGDRIARTVEGLLTFARRRQEDKALISVDGILSDSLALTAAQMRKDGIHVKTDIAASLPHILAQAHEIEQVFVNIISNARHALNEKYQEPHENKTLEITADALEVNDRNFVRLCFRDNGCGIPPEIIDKVMNPFFSTKTNGKRTGLGLSISQAILEEHGGKLMLESKVGQYTRVIIDLPVALRRSN